MSFYLGDKKAKLFKGDYKPLNLYLGDKKVAGWEQSAKTGNSLSFDNTYNDTANVKIYGHSEQVVTTQGKNLFDLYRIFATTHVVDPYKCLDGAYANNNTVLPNNANIEIGNNELKVNSFVGGCGAGFYIPVISGITYTMMFDADVVSTGSYLGYTFRKSNSDIVGTYATVSNKTFTFTVPEEAKYIFVVFRLPPADGECIYSNIQLELGSTSTDYEPFAPNSPSPNYPSPIKSVENFDLVGTGKNLYSSGFEYGNISFSTGQNSVLSVPNSAIRSIDYIRVSPNTQYKFSSFSSDASNKWQDIRYVYQYGSNYEFLGFYNLDSGLLWKSPIDCHYIKTRTNSSTIYSLPSLEEMKIQLEVGETSSADYTPFSGLQIINFPHKLGSLPDGTCDYILIDNVEKKAWLIKNIYEAIFNGTENWKDGTVYMNIKSLDFTGLEASAYRDSVAQGGYLCNRYTYKFANETNMFYMTIASNVSKFVFYNPTELSVAEWKAKLAEWNNAGTPLVVRYKLATPIITELDYEEIKTYYPFTEFYTTGSEIKPELDVTVRTVL